MNSRLMPATGPPPLAPISTARMVPHGPPLATTQPPPPSHQVAVEHHPIAAHHHHHGHQMLLTMPPPPLPPPPPPPPGPGGMDPSAVIQPISMTPAASQMASVTVSNNLCNSASIVSPPRMQPSSIRQTAGSFITNGGYHSHGHSGAGSLVSPANSRASSTTSVHNKRRQTVTNHDYNKQQSHIMGGYQLQSSQKLQDPQRRKDSSYQQPKVNTSYPHQTAVKSNVNSKTFNLMQQQPPPAVMSFHNHNKNQVHIVSGSSGKAVHQHKDVVVKSVEFDTSTIVNGGGGQFVQGESDNSIVKTSESPKEKTPMCLVNELARYNKTTHQYRLTDEAGPAHKKSFTVCLKLGETEEYIASGPSIKKAQHAAAAIALEKTALKHPPDKPKSTKIPVVTPTVELNALAMKRGEPTIYQFLHSNKDDEKDSRTNGAFNSIKIRSAAGFVQGKVRNSFLVSLKVGQRQFYGEGHTAQAAKHSAAEKALSVLKDLKSIKVGVILANSKLDVKSNLNPASVPFVPASMAGQVTTESSNSSAKLTESHKGVKNVNNNQEDDESQADKFDDIKSPISLVHECALKRNLTVRFEVVKETGPPHMRTFITTCLMGDFVTQGEGNGKRSSKKRAAERMIQKLKTLPPIASCHVPPKKKSSSSSAGKSKKAKNLIKIEQKANVNYGQSINPISRLIQIQQAKKEREPVFTLIAEKGMPRRREFVMQVTVSDQTSEGSGPNKKLAKRAAAENLLKILGYCKPSPLPGKPSLKSSTTDPVSDKDSSPTVSVAASASQQSSEKAKKLTFVDDIIHQEIKSGTTTSSSTSASVRNAPSIPNGIASEDHIPKPIQVEQTKSSDKVGGKVISGSKPDNDSSSSSSGKSGSNKGTAKSHLNAKNSSKMARASINSFSHNGDLNDAAESDVKKTGKKNASSSSSKEELESLATMLDFKVSYKTFPQKSQNKEIVTLVKLSTDPPKVCHGSGNSVEESQNDAASRALVFIVDDDFDESNAVQSSDSCVDKTEDQLAAATVCDEATNNETKKNERTVKPNQIVEVSAPSPDRN